MKRHLLVIFSILLLAVLLLGVGTGGGQAQFLTEDIKAQANILNEVTSDTSTSNSNSSADKILAIENQIKSFALKQRRAENIKRAAKQKIELFVYNDAASIIYQRPQNYIAELNDKRLKNLPNKGDINFTREEIIAIRYHGLVLLNNKKCKGIISGGRSLSIKGWLYVVCSDSPNRLRQFPLVVFDSLKPQTRAKLHQG